MVYFQLFLLIFIVNINNFFLCFFLGHLNSTASSPTCLMPDNLLNDDLQLSESESDST